MPATKRKSAKTPDTPQKTTFQQYQSYTEWKGPPVVSAIWAPKVQTVFKILLSVRLTAAVWSNISDCDETYNYWEPGHYLLYGQGFQTWEYSPIYAIRSYAYIALHLLPIRALSLFTKPDKMAVFYLIRCMLGFFCAAAETYFYRGVLKHYGAAVARLTCAFLLCSTGMFISSAAWLPSSFSMYMTLVSMAAWFSGHLPIAIVATAISTFLGWPFAAILGLPIAIDMLLYKKKVKLFIGWSVFSCLVILLPMIAYDSDKFGKLVVAPMNIVLYNVLTDHGPNLYGTEPWTFYFVNGFLNFNIVFMLSLVAIFITYIMQYITDLKFPGLPHWLSMAGFYLWIAVFFTQPHKEERFLFPIYPLVCVNGALALDSVQRLIAYVISKGRHYTQVFPYMPLFVITVFATLSASRILALYKGYHGPIEVYSKLNQVANNKSIHTLSPNKLVHVCVGKEWYRYPNSFFLPKNWKLKFVKSEFRGQLPSEYLSDSNGTKVIPANMNDMNREETSRYVNEDRCHYMIDLDLATSAPREPNYSQDTNKWQLIESVPFLNSARSHPIYRAYYIPYISRKHCNYGSYNLLKTRARQKVSS